MEKIMFIQTASEAEAEGKLREIYEGDRKNMGYVPNHAKPFPPSHIVNYRLLIILTFIFRTPLIGQDINSIILTSQKADEPPAKHGQPKYLLKYKRQENGDLSALNIYEDKRKKQLTGKKIIERERVIKIDQWRISNKRKFSLAELDIELDALKALGEISPYKLNFEIPEDIIVNIDSFNFCQPFTMTKTMSTGGETINLTLINETGLELNYNFDSNFIGQGTFNIQDYIFCYKLLIDRIPDEFPHYNFFTREMLMEIILYYQKTVECEGFYYKEFTDKNPNITSKDRRMMTGWNFVEYMNQRDKNNEK